MSEEQVADTAADTAVAEPTNESQGQEATPQVESSSSPSIIQAAAGPNPLDTIFSEEVMSQIPDGPQKNWLAGQKNGEGLMKGIAGFQKLAGQKGFERPPEGADEAAVEAFNAKVRELRGAPESVDGYELSVPEGFELPDEMQQSIKEYALESGKGPDEINADIQKFVEMRNQLNEIESQQRIQEEGKKLTEVIEGFDNAKGNELSAYLENSGVDLTDRAYENAETMRWVHKTMQLERKVAELTGEDVSIAATPSALGSNTLDTLQTRLNDLVSGDSDKAKAFRDPMFNRKLNEQAKAEYLEINKKISELRRKQT